MTGSTRAAHRSATERATILLVEDDQVDIQGFRRAMARLGLANEVVTVSDGIEALERLRGMGGPPLARPHLVVLDLNLPRMSGIELLRELRSDPELRRTVVFVLTTSRAEQDKVQAYQLNVAGYIVKADPEDGLQAAVSLLEHYWRVVELP